ncbi:probable ubiquitin-conjugating enzyme E2 25 [Spinacia oleracea]|uniref:Probable ubiquitin-conjugating enzyme E2 25 n=1 Tax=Spinacia oleracea TaxID=3562 RepID=A0ABM3QRX1_SPIOL|nr:probable ubiquitin-conjugating enzyme E2 25 [Spinacia oleracea]
MAETTPIFPVKSEIEEILDDVDQSFITFQNFDVHSFPPYDHHFIVNPPPPERPKFFGSRRQNEELDFKNRIEREWDLLRDNLPKTIAVRVYEGRKQFMRVAIIGLTGSPYAYGLFFFDIFLPKEYPSKPPLIFHHHSHKPLDWNPTLLNKNKNKNSNYYSNKGGSGSGSHYRWDPQTSNIRHMLESIQANELRFLKIYDNVGEKDFLLSHRNMIRTLRSPPEGFGVFVQGYFRKYSHAILLNFKLRRDLSVCQKRTNLFFMLVEAFEGNGSYCKHLVYGVKRVVTSQDKMVVNGEASMGELARRALLKTNSLITNWFCDNDSDGRDRYRTIHHH